MKRISLVLATLLLLQSGTASAQKPVWQSPILVETTPTHSVELDAPIQGAREIWLIVRDGGDGYAFDHADWMSPTLHFKDGSQKKLIDLDWKTATTEWGQVRKNKSAGGSPLRVAGKDVPHGIGVHANSLIHFALPENVVRLKGRVGIDNAGSDQNGESSLQFQVYTVNPGPITEAKAAPTPGSSSAARGGDGDPVETLDHHPGVDVRLFAQEPLLLSPSAIDIDRHGRVWVCEVVNYRRHKGKRPEGDRILVLDDVDGDGKADEVTVFHQGNDVDSAHGICVLGDRVIVSAGDDVFSLYDTDGDGKSDKKELMFTNIGGSQHDHGIHAFHFGPDGKLYFNFGNAGHRLCGPDGEVIVDLAGNKVERHGKPYREGMVFRCDLDGTNVETLGWNFRNNWEAAVDAFGTIWQSDNDDDGNKGVRINYVMEFGNYGYKDEFTGAGWRDPRPNIEAEVPLMHWHLNDPGVVPNLLQTGQGSPTGICLYEGTLLPAVFRNQVIHCDAGPNVVRAYPVEPDGAGYSARMENLVTSTRDRWFRPSDVCVAPDGSVLIADWYDPGVGGHGMGDLDRGRIYRVVPKNHRALYDAPRSMTALGSPADPLISLLSSPNMDTRYEAYQILASGGEGSIGRLLAAYRNESLPLRHRARALWLAMNLGTTLEKNFWTGAAPGFQIVALRAIRQLHGADSPDLLEAVKLAMGGIDLHIGSAGQPAQSADEPTWEHLQRECAIALRFQSSDEADQVWTELAKKLQPDDRWQLEALGIGADLHWESRWAAFESGPTKENSDTYAELAWRSRVETAPIEHAKLALEAEAKGGNAERYLRAIEFTPSDEKKKVAYDSLFWKGSPTLALVAAGKIGTKEIATKDGAQAHLDSLIEPMRGKPEFVRLAEKLRLKGFDDELINYIEKSPQSPEAITAARLILRGQDWGKIWETLIDGERNDRARVFATALGKTNEGSAVNILKDILLKHKDATPSYRSHLVESLSIGRRGGEELLKLAKADQLDENLKKVTALALARSPDGHLRKLGAQQLPVPKAPGSDKPLAELMAVKGNAANGPAAYTKATCHTCHQATGIEPAIDFGPNLSQIGDKLGKEALYQSILYPSGAISHGFHGVQVERKNDGGTLVGYITGETEKEVTLRLPGGVDQRVEKSAIAKTTEMEISLMPEGLGAILTPQELADLCAWLATLK